ncbi:hypothetical protein EJ110_NYTH24391 [Nymphaea thermarum]|nr:hypothetical protein EJ110_NYTH24391 [Nymphaea thermarum]
MATAAFKSTTKRSPIGAGENSSASSRRTEEDARSSNRSGFHRRSRSLSRGPSRFPAFRERESGATGDNSGRFVNTERGSAFPEVSLEDLVNEFLAEVAVEEDRGRATQRGSCVGMSETEAVKRRGRSASRPGRLAAGAGAAKGSVDSSRRRRSVSVAPYQFSDSESDKDHLHTLADNVKPVASESVKSTHGFSNKSSRRASLANNQCGLRRSLSQRDLSSSRHAYSSALTDDEGQDTCYDTNGEKTIRAVYAQRKAEHPDGEGIGAEAGPYEAMRKEVRQAMRKEVRQAVAVIKTELEHAMVKANSNELADGDCVGRNAKDVRQAIDKIKKDYTAILQQSDKRKRELLAELAVEEQRGRELSKIVGELLLNPKQPEPARSSRSRKRSTDRTRMSNRLTEEAEKYFEDFISNVEDTDFSSFDDERSDATLGESTLSRDCVLRNARSNPLPTDADGVLLPWLQWETSNDSSSLLLGDKFETPVPKGHVHDFTQVMSVEGKLRCESNEHVTSSRGSWSPDDANDSKFFMSVDSYPRVAGDPFNEKSKSESSSISSFDMDVYLRCLHKEELIVERVKQRHRICSGGLMLCLTEY